jgi:beta-alanine degradation protein BauB
MLDRSAVADWPQELQDELQQGFDNGCVGTMLVSETGKLRVWHLMLRPGERIGFHRHVLNYFWTVMTHGAGRSRHHDGRIVETTYRAGDTRHFSFGPGEYMLHDLENIGQTMLVFTTVEHVDSANPPLPVPASVYAPQSPWSDPGVQP